MIIIIIIIMIIIIIIIIIKTLLYCLLSTQQLFHQKENKHAQTYLLCYTVYLGTVSKE